MKGNLSMAIQLNLVRSFFPNNKRQKRKWICDAYTACNKSVIHFIHRSIILSVQYSTETSQEDKETSKKPEKVQIVYNLGAFDFYRLEFDTDRATFFPAETKVTWIIFLSGNRVTPQLHNKLVCNSLVFWSNSWHHEEWSQYLVINNPITNYVYLSYGHFHSTLHWCARDWTTRAGNKKKITLRKFSLETTLRPELIPGYQAWTSVPELPVPRWEDLINTSQKSNSYHLFKIYRRSQDWYFEARSINFHKNWSETKV